jgi:1-acyl-sn-glycerol-3-phosphate acyltransferase
MRSSRPASVACTIFSAKRLEGWVEAVLRAIRHIGWATYEYVAMFIGLGSLALICLASAPASLVLLPLPRSWRIPLGRRLIARGFRTYLWILRTLCCVKLDVQELAPLRHEPGVMVIANHPSLLDAVIILSCLPRGCCVMKSQLQNSLLFGPFSRLSGYILNDDPVTLIRQACSELQEGAQLLIFPESTRTVQPPLNPMSKTSALISARSGAPMQTVVLDYSSLYLGKTWPLWRKPELPLVIRLRMGKRFGLEPDQAQDIQKTTEALEIYYRHELQSFTDR